VIEICILLLLLLILYCGITLDDDCNVRVKSDSLEWAAAVASLLRRLYELSAWQPVITARLSAYIAAVTVSSLHLQLLHLQLVQA